MVARLHCSPCKVRATVVPQTTSSTHTLPGFCASPVASLNQSNWITTPDLTDVAVLYSCDTAPGLQRPNVTIRGVVAYEPLMDGTLWNKVCFYMCANSTHHSVAGWPVCSPCRIVCGGGGWAVQQQQPRHIQERAGLPGVAQDEPGQPQWAPQLQPTVGHPGRHQFPVWLSFNIATLNAHSYCTIHRLPPVAPSVRPSTPSRFR